MNVAPPVQQSVLASATSIVAEGASVGRYRLEQRIGAGGVGQIWRARHAELGHAVAIKLLEAGADGARERRRFLQEARLSAQLGRACRHIVRVEDHGVIEMSGSVYPYLVMELLEGETLASRLRREPRLTLNEVATVVEHVARALTVTHAAGIVHRDLKPSNIFLSTDGETGVCTKLIDFGIARDTSGDGVTRTGSIIGTPGYMSPEQISGRDLDARADLWSLSAVIFRMLTLKPPFGSGTFEELTARVLWQVAAAPSSLQPELPSAFDQFMARGLARSASQRFQTAEELSATFSAIVRAVELGCGTDLQLTAPVSEAITETAPSLPLASDPPLSPDMPGRAVAGAAPATGGQRRLVWGLLLAGAVVASAGAAWTRWRGPVPGAPPQPVSTAMNEPWASPSHGTSGVASSIVAPPAPAVEQPSLAPTIAPILPSAPPRKGTKPVPPAPKRVSAAPQSSAKRSWLDTREM